MRRGSCGLAAARCLEIERKRSSGIFFGIRISGIKAAVGYASPRSVPASSGEKNRRSTDGDSPQ